MAKFYEPGNYRCLVVDQAWQRASTGTRMLVLTITPEAALYERVAGNGQVVAEEVPTKAQYDRTVRLAITANSATMALKKLRAAGFTGEKWSQIDLAGTSIVCACSEETYDSKPVERWDLPLPGRGKLQSDDSLAAELDVEMPLAGAMMAAAGAAVTAPGAGPAAGDDDDIPF